MVSNQNNKKNIIDLVNSIPGLNYGETEEEVKHLDSIAILTLPKHLRKSAIAMLQILKGDASTVSKISGNDEESEESYLEELVDLGYLAKQVTGSNVSYEIKI